MKFTPHNYQSYILYGEIKTFSPDEIISANVREAVNPLSAELVINTLGFRVHSNDARFNIMQPTGVYRLLQQLQPLKVWLNAGNSQKPMGVYYLEEWENDTENTVKISAVDALGILDKTSFKGGMYSGVTVSTLVGMIALSGGVDYELEPALADITLSGWLAICTHREALQQVAFAIGAVVSCSHSGVINIYRPATEVATTISYERKLLGHKITLKPLVTGVEIIAHNYSAGTEAVELFKGALTLGQHEILFKEPAHSLTVTGATIASSGTNYAIVSVTVAGEITINGKRYNDSMQLIGVYMPDLPAAEKQNILKIEEATLINTANALAVAQRIYDYYQIRYSDEGNVLLVDEKAGDMVKLDSLYNQSIEGRIESLDINLTGGFVGKAVITGVVG